MPAQRRATPGAVAGTGWVAAWYTFGGTEYQLPITEVTRGNASHGLARRIPWSGLSKQTPESIELTCVLAPQPGYPFALGLTTKWSVGPAGLRADHTAVSRAKPAPFGFGAHPYLRVGTERLDGLVLSLPGVRAADRRRAAAPDRA